MSGGGTGTSKDQLNKQNALQEKAFNAQQEQLAQLKGSFGRYLDQNIGYDPAQMAMLQSQFQNQNSNAFNQAGTNVRSALAARGGGTGSAPPSGMDVRGLLGLSAAQAQSQSQGTLGLGISNLQQALTNRFNAGSLLSGNAATLSSPISTFGSGANNALSNYVSASNQGFGAQFMSGLGASLGKGIGAGFSPGGAALG